MACIVTGFPSNIAALQFEWAWQNSHLTRHIPDDDRISIAITKTKTNRKTGRTRRRKARPGMNLTERLENLHLLLGAPSFARWPLELRFFVADVHAAWTKRCRQLGDDLQGRVSVVLDLPTASSASGGVETVGGFAGIDPSYLPIKQHVEKTSFLLAEGESVPCAVCGDMLESKRTSLVCSNPGCNAASHMTCLSSHFLASQPPDDNIILPKEGQCPKCRSDLRWLDLVREMTLRTRGEKDLAKLLKTKKKRGKAASVAGVAAAAAASVVEAPEDEDDEASASDEDEMVRAEDVVDEPHRYEVDDDDDDDDDDAISVTSAGTAASDPGLVSRRAAPARDPLDDVVEDSEWDDVDVLN